MSKDYVTGQMIKTTLQHVNELTTRQAGLSEAGSIACGLASMSGYKRSASDANIAIFDRFQEMERDIVDTVTSFLEAEDDYEQAYQFINALDKDVMYTVCQLVGLDLYRCKQRLLEMFGHYSYYERDRKPDES